MRFVSLSKPNLLNLVRLDPRKLAILTVGLLVLGRLVVGSDGINEVLAACVNDVDTHDELLAYALWGDDGNKSLWLYDPRNDVNTQLGVETDSTTFSLSADGYLAYSSGQEGNAQIYVLNTQVANSSPVSIAQDPASSNYPLAWSPDGRYLAFESNTDHEDRIYVWDGNSATDISPEGLDIKVSVYGVEWSNDGRLAYSIDHSEIYLWDGVTTTSLSQNPAGEDLSPAWSRDGQVAFLSQWGSEYDIFVWDGVSVENGVPARDTFTNISPELTFYMSDPEWTQQGCLSFISGQVDASIQTYLWDGQTAINISQNPTLHNGNAVWSPDGHWAFVTFFSRQQLLYVRDGENRTLLTVAGQYPPAWSLNGELAFCSRGSRGWVLSTWDEQEINIIEQGREIWAQWQSGAEVHCTSG